jgi:putative sigma-54 modulation protein
LSLSNVVMRLDLTGRHVDITPTLRRLVDAKLVKLDRLLSDSAVSAQVVLMRDKYRLLAEITLHARGEKFLHAVGSSEAWETSLTQAVDKIAQQAQKVKGKWQAKKRRVRRAPAERAVQEPRAAPRAVTRELPRMPRIFRSTRQAIKSMSVAEAAREMDAQPDGLVIFRDPDRASVSVLYRHRNGELTLVETEA